EDIWCWSGRSKVSRRRSTNYGKKSKGATWRKGQRWQAGSVNFNCMMRLSTIITMT
ncbi:hypothetical protein FRC03_008367, partial [Tulasnella sp. 419]